MTGNSIQDQKKRNEASALLEKYGLLLKRSETYHPCTLCLLDRTAGFCRISEPGTFIISTGKPRRFVKVPSFFETERLGKTDYYFLICRLNMLTIPEETKEEIKKRRLAEINRQTE